MTGQRFNGLFESLEASFDAAEARAEREAAADLALSLRQDRSTVDVLSRSGWCIDRVGATPVAVLALGRDYAATARRELIPLRCFVARPSSSVQAPEIREDSLCERLRQWTREGGIVDVSTGTRGFSGRLVATGRDHLIVRTKGGEVLIAQGAVEKVTRLRGSSVDAF